MNNSITDHEKHYRHLSLMEREEIYGGLSAEESVTEIARRIGRHHSTVSREIRRNVWPFGRLTYSPSEAQRLYHKRFSKSHSRLPLKSPEIRSYVYHHLKRGWSPEIIAGRLPVECPGLSSNYESIYQYIYRYRRNWTEFLPQGHKKRRKRGSTRAKRALIPEREWIDQRSEAANSRTEMGHWEADTVISRQSASSLQVLLERKSRYCILTHLPRRTAHNMSKYINYNLARLPPHLRKSITYDNGLENVEHQRTNAVLQTQSYFCHPYHSWEKGSVEQLIGLLRRYLPKKTNLASIDRWRLKYIEWLLNTRPRKCLGFRTPKELFFGALNC